MAKRSDHEDAEIIEQGDIFFFYRPKVEEHEPDGIEDVQRFHIVLRPEGGEPIRLMTIGRKRLPDVDDHERVWGFVDKVARSAKEIEAELREQRYGTKTRGERTRPAARPAGEGVYALVRDEHKLFLAYELELPREPGGAVQRELNIERQAAYVLSIKNPEAGSPPGAGLSRREKAGYPPRLEAEFEGRRFAAEDPRLLDFEGAEFVLIGARSDPERAYDLDIEAGHDRGRTADVLRELRMSPREHPFEPLIAGRWR
jgi:hypothetical protein